MYALIFMERGSLYSFPSFLSNIDEFKMTLYYEIPVAKSPKKQSEGVRFC